MNSKKYSIKDTKSNINSFLHPVMLSYWLGVGLGYNRDVVNIHKKNGVVKKYNIRKVIIGFITISWSYSA